MKKMYLIKLLIKKRFFFYYNVILLHCLFENDSFHEKKISRSFLNLEFYELQFCSNNLTRKIFNFRDICVIQNVAF